MTKVSVWAGTAESLDRLENDLTFAFTEDGDAIPGPFSAAFQIDWFDDDYREASFHPEKTPLLEQLLSRHSCGSEIINAFGSKCRLQEPFSAVVILFEFKYSAGIESVVFRETCKMRFVGCVEIE